MSYRMVHLRIRSKGYNSKWESDTDESAFKEESRRIFQELGWALKPGGNGICDIVTKGNVIIALSHHSPRCWKQPRRRQGEGTVVGARSGG